MTERRFSLQAKVEEYYNENCIPITHDVTMLIENSLALGLEEDEVLENLKLRAKKPPAHLMRGALVLLLRQQGGWIYATLRDVVKGKGYVVEWEEAPGDIRDVTIPFSNSAHIRPRDWDPVKAGAGEIVEPSSPPRPQPDESLDDVKAAAEAREKAEEEASAAKKAEEAKAAAEEAKKAEAAAEAAKKVAAAEEAKKAAAAAEQEKKDAAAAAEAAKEAEDKPAAEEPKVVKKATFKTPTKKNSGGMLSVDARGTGLLDEISNHLDDAKVQFCLVQVPLGTGTFQRTKTLFLPWVGQKSPAMKRAKAVQKTGEVSEAVGSTHASLTLTDKKECNLEHVLSELKHVFVADNGEFSIANLKEEIHARVKEAQKKKEEKALKAQQTLAEMPNIRPTASSMGKKLDEIMREIRKPLGAFNWALFAADPSKLTLIEAGSDSVEEMREYLDDSKVMFGLLRLAFGLGNFRRTKWICVTFVGSSIGPVARGKLLSCKPEMTALLKPHQVSFEIQGTEEMTLEQVIDKTRPFIVSDDIQSSAKLTIADFNKALAEEKVKTAEFFGEDPTATMATLMCLDDDDLAEEFDLKETIDRVQNNDDPLLWAVFSLNE